MREHRLRNRCKSTAIARTTSTHNSGPPLAINPIHFEAGSHQIGPKQNGFFLFYAEKVLPRGKVPEIIPHHRRIAMTNLETLDNLVKICVDSAERYRRAAAAVGKEALVQFFKRQEAGRRRHADELNLDRKQLGGEGEPSGKESGSVAGFMDRAEMDVHVVMSRGGN